MGITSSSFEDCCRCSICGCDPNIPLGLSAALERPDSIPIFRTLPMTLWQLKTLWQVFSYIDDDSNGFATIYEFVLYCGLENSIFTKRAFEIFDVDSSGELSFAEFCLSAWTYCTLERKALILFAFDLYDLDQSGTISTEEMKRILYEVYGSTPDKRKMIERETIKIDLLATSVDTHVAGSKKQQRTGLITQQNFVRYVEKHPTMLWPVFTMQRQLYSRLGGVAFWRTATYQRQERAAYNQALQYGNFKSVISTIYKQSSRYVGPGSMEGGATPGVASADGAASPSAPDEDDRNSVASGGGAGGRRRSRRMSRLQSKPSNRRISTGKGDAFVPGGKLEDDAFGNFQHLTPAQRAAVKGASGSQRDLPAGTALPGTAEALGGTGRGTVGSNAAGEFTELGSLESKGAPAALALVQSGQAGEDYEAHKGLSLADRRRIMYEKGHLTSQEQAKIKAARRRASQSTRNFLQKVDGKTDMLGQKVAHDSAGSQGGATPRLPAERDEHEAVSGLRAASKAVKRKNRRASTGIVTTGGAGGRGGRRASVDLAVARRRQSDLGFGPGGKAQGQLSDASRTFTSNLKKSGKLYARHRRASAAAARAPHVRGRRASVEAQVVDYVRRAQLLAQAVSGGVGGTGAGAGGGGGRRASAAAAPGARRSTAGNGGTGRTAVLGAGTGRSSRRGSAAEAGEGGAGGGGAQALTGNPEFQRPRRGRRGSVA